MDSYILFATKNKKQEENMPQESGRLSDIIKMSQDISGDWLKKVAEKKLMIQEQIQDQKSKPGNKK